MRTIPLERPIDVESQSVDQITLRDPDDRRLRTMRRGRKSVAGFTYEQNLSFASRLSALGELALKQLSARDYAKLAAAIEETYQAAQGRHARWLDHQHRERANG